jgi:hypothetical protein
MLPQGTELTPEAAKDAIARGATYGEFGYLGYASGFDWYATDGKQTWNMGEEVPVGTSVDLHVTVPTVYGLTARDEAPVVTARILRAEGDGWTEVAHGTSGEVVAKAVPNSAYRAEVRILPNHLRPSLGTTPEKYLKEQLWVYGNAIYVGTNYGAPTP